MKKLSLLFAFMIAASPLLAADKTKASGATKPQSAASSMASQAGGATNSAASASANGGAMTSAAAMAALPATHPLKAAPDMYKWDWENAQARVMEVSFQPGQKIAKHTHTDAQLVYVLEPGQLTIYGEDGKSSVSDLQKGQVLWMQPQTHWAQNTGKTPVKLLVTELKQSAAGAAGGAGATGANESGNQPSQQQAQ